MRPDIGVLGRYTYLATELFWGTIAATLLYRANAVRKAAVTILALYPIAYLWDRYTLAVGVFSIELRTGIEIAGIPLEEHLFMAVVPGLVIGFHETIFGSEQTTITE
ncbi:lycopene cyclase domain-containing protein [Natrialba aegyptia]|uniref:Lycopene cyclase domain-containing protein n=1 Tax=Natrialba aegyptia DSM 13077 TaxID=1227491 RepID=M0B057_9EURY|nr:lycopene cyclase domain-containing protein [Natrialba aegyptia]ELZ03054.1 lycopene cyclase domain-containing protein [Natrialba aegyptia DSM 13077]